MAVQPMGGKEWSTWTDGRTDEKAYCCIDEQSSRPPGDVVPGMQHLLLTHTFIWAVDKQLTALDVISPELEEE